MKSDISNEQKDLLKYCNDIIKIAPENSVEFKIAKLALMQLNNECAEIISTCKEIKENSPIDSPQNKIVNLVLNQLEGLVTPTFKSDLRIPEGWKIVPINPRPEMFMFIPGMAKMTINRDEYDVSRLNERNALWIYNQMLNRSPDFKE